MESDIPTSIRQLIDKDQIIDLVHRYSYCVDHRLYDEVVGLFTEDCVADYGPGIAPVRSRAALRRMFGHPGGGFEDLDHASVRTSVYAWHKRPDGVTPQLWGYYHDTVVRLSEGWRIAHRQLRVLGAEDWPMEMHPATDVGSV